MTIARPQQHPTKLGTWVPPPATQPHAQPSTRAGSRDAIEPLPEHVWGKVIELLPARNQAIAACTHPLWRRVCSDSRLDMHRAHLHHALEDCADASAMIAALEKHRHVLPHLDTLRLQPKLLRRLQAATHVDAVVAVRSAAPEPEALFPVLDWLDKASGRAFQILAVCDTRFLCVALTNGMHKRHPTMTDACETFTRDIPYPETTASWLALMPKVAHITDAITLADVTRSSNDLAAQQSFWEQFVQYYPQTRWLFIKHEQFQAGIKFVDVLCGLQHLCRLIVGGLTPEGLPPGLKARHAAGLFELATIEGS